MTYSTAALTFKEPTETQVKLSAELAATIHDLNKKKRESFFHLCIIAYGLRKRNLEKAKGDRRGGNAKGEKYKGTFEAWYKKNAIEDAYGTLSNFTLYAMAGRLLNYVRWQLDEKYIERLPATLTVLYRLSQVLGDKGGKVTPETKAALKKILLDKKDGSSKASYFINPQTTLSDIQKKLDASLPTPSKRKTKEGEVLFTIYVSKELKDGFYKTTKTRKKGSVDLAHVNSLQKEINALLEKHGQGKQWFWSITNEKLINKTKDKTDFDKNIRQGNQ